MKPERAQLEDVLSSLANPSLRYADLRYTATHQQHVKVRNGEVAIVLDTLERALPRYVVEIHKNELLRDSLIADTAMMATKRFYVCTGTSIPEEIGEILKPVALAEDACPSGN